MKMRWISRIAVLVTLLACIYAKPTVMRALQTAPQASPQAPAQAPAQKAPAVDTWKDDFDGSALDDTKWEKFSFEGGSGGTLKVEKGQLKMRAVTGSRSGVRTKTGFTADRYIVEATVAKVGPAMPEPGASGAPIGNAILTLLFDTSGRNRMEWIFTSEGTFEAWYVSDARGERLDNRKLASKEKSPTLGIVRRGDEFFFMLNGEAGVQTTIKGVPRTFHVMLYGYGSSQDEWESVLVRTVKAD
jgi:hypothetical protein